MAKQINTEQKVNKKPGRPVKTFGRRIQTTIYSDSKLLDIIDELVGAGKDYDSRSEFYHQASVLYLGTMGKMPTKEE